MIFLGTILFLLLLVSMVGTIVGLFKPALFKQTNRWKVSALGFGTFFAIFVLLVVVAELDQTPAQTEVAEKPALPKATKKVKPPKKVETVAPGNLAKDKRFVNIFLESLEDRYALFLEVKAQLGVDEQNMLNQPEANRPAIARRLLDNWGSFSASYNRFNNNFLPENPGAPKELGAEWKNRKCKQAIDSVYFQPKLMFSAWSRFNSVIEGRETRDTPFNEAHQAVLKGFKQIRQDSKLCK